MKVTRAIRVKLVAHMCDNVSYLEVTPKGYQLMGQQRTPFSLSNISQNAAEFGFALEDAKTERDVLDAIKKYACYTKSYAVI